MQCPNCGSENHFEGAAFCWNCHEPLNATPTETKEDSEDAKQGTDLNLEKPPDTNQQDPGEDDALKLSDPISFIMDEPPEGSSYKAGGRRNDPPAERPDDTPADKADDQFSLSISGGAVGSSVKLEEAINRAIAEMNGQDNDRQQDAANDNPKEDSPQAPQESQENTDAAYGAGSDAPDQGGSEMASADTKEPDSEQTMEADAQDNAEAPEAQAESREEATVRSAPDNVPDDAQDEVPRQNAIMNSDDQDAGPGPEDDARESQAPPEADSFEKQQEPTYQDVQAEPRDDGRDSQPPPDMDAGIEKHVSARQDEQPEPQDDARDSQAPPDTEVTVEKHVPARQDAQSGPPDDARQGRGSPKADVLVEEHKPAPDYAHPREDSRPPEKLPSTQKWNSVLSIKPQPPAEGIAASKQLPRVSRSKGVILLSGNNLILTGGRKVVSGDEVRIGEQTYEVRVKPEDNKRKMMIIAGASALLILIIALIMIVSGGDGRLVGILVDNHGNYPLSEQTVRIVELNRSVKTNLGGFFIFDDLSPGLYTLQYMNNGIPVSEVRIAILAGDITTVTLHSEESGGSASIKTSLPELKKKT